MNWDYVITAISAVCTVFSIIGAYKSNAYYKKSKQLTIYANTNLAYIESQKIIATLDELLDLGNIKITRGKNYPKQVSQKGRNMKTSIDKIKESLPIEGSTEINALLGSQQEYINSLIIGTRLNNDERLVIDDDFKKCQQAFDNMKLLIKKKLENFE